MRCLIMKNDLGQHGPSRLKIEVSLCPPNCWDGGRLVDVVTSATSLSHQGIWRLRCRGGSGVVSGEFSTHLGMVWVFAEFFDLIIDTSNGRN